jgi:hypothetical protein
MEDAWTLSETRKSSAVVRFHGTVVKYFYRWYLQNGVVLHDAYRLSTPYGFLHVPTAYLRIRYNSDRVKTGNNGRLYC